MTRLTEQAHATISTVLKVGEIAVDATAGNGHDTLFLCQTVGSAGSVYALDIQQEALDQTANRLQTADYHNYHLICCNHSQLMELIPEHCHQQIGAIMFNLGYLPGGDHEMITKSKSTLAAIHAALELLRPQGILTILAYPGHKGGSVETKAVSELLAQVDNSKFITEMFSAQSESENAPRLFVVRKTNHETSINHC